MRNGRLGHRHGRRLGFGFGPVRFVIGRLEARGRFLAVTVLAGGRLRTLRAVDVGLEHVTAVLGQQAEQLSVGQLHFVTLRFVIAGQSAPAQVLVGARRRRGGRAAALVRVNRAGRHRRRRSRVVSERLRLLAQLLVDVLVLGDGRAGSIDVLVSLLLSLAGATGAALAEADEAVVVDQHRRHLVVRRQRGGAVARYAFRSVDGRVGG